MTEEIIKSITEAEARAAKIKESAFAQVAEIAAKAEERAFEIEKSSEEVCRAYRETQLKAAEADAEKAYLSALAQKREEAKQYADRLLENTELPVSRIVGRITGGNR